MNKKFKVFINENKELENKIGILLNENKILHDQLEKMKEDSTISNLKLGYIRQNFKSEIRKSVG